MPPGGSQGIARLAALTGRSLLPLSPAHGQEAPRTVAVIDENWCIGCTLCLKACPTDAIVGLNKRMHTVITPHCTGCELCLPVCPVDCIQMENASGQATGWAAWSLPQAEHARARYRGRQARLQREACEAEQAVPVAPPQAPAEQDPKRAAIAAALARARAQRTAQG